MREYVDRAESLHAELHRALGSIWFKDFDLEKAKRGEFAPFSNGAALREPIFYGGDSAYSFQYREFAAKKYANDKSWLEENKKFDIDEAISVANAIGKLLTKKENELPRLLLNTPPGEWTALPAHIFSVSEVADNVDLDHDLVARIVEAFCFHEGAGNDQFTSLQEYNITNATPVIRLLNGEYVLFQHYSLMEAIYEGPFFWMAGDKAYSSVAFAHRGEFLEKVIFERLQGVFGRHVFANVHVEKSKGDEVGEIDVLVLFGDRAVILQAKSKRLTLEARKGNDAQVKDDFKNAVQDAYDQALTCAKALAEGNCRLLDRDMAEIKPETLIKEIFLVCVVSDHYPALAFQARQFLKAEETGAIRAPLVIDVFALDAIAEMLDTPLRLLSYFMLRSRFGARIISTHEFTLLSTHLKHNLWINDEYDMVTFADDISIHLDAAMLVRREGAPGARTPDGLLTRMEGTHVGRMIRNIESRAEPATISLGFLLLTLSEETLNSINDAIDRIASQAKNDGENHDITMIFEKPSAGLTIHCNDRPEREAADALIRHCELRKYSTKAAKWFGLVLSPRSTDVRFGLTLEGEWAQSDLMDEAVKKMRSRPLSPEEFRMVLSGGKRKIGRNETCPCGSGDKYKRCCGR